MVGSRGGSRAGSGLGPRRADACRTRPVLVQASRPGSGAVHRHAVAEPCAAATVLAGRRSGNGRPDEGRYGAMVLEEVAVDGPALPGRATLSASPCQPWPISSRRATNPRRSRSCFIYAVPVARPEKERASSASGKQAACRRASLPPGPRSAVSRPTTACSGPHVDSHLLAIAGTKSVIAQAVKKPVAGRPHRRRGRREDVTRRTTTRSRNSS